MDRSESIQKHFGGAAAAYAVSAVHVGGPDLEAMLLAAALRAGERVLDLGCGPGHTAMAFAARGADVTAVDLTEAMLETGRKLASERGLSVDFQRADVRALPFEDGAFDVVTSRLSAHHYADPSAVLREVARVLAPGGRFLLVDIVAPEDAAQDTFLNAFELLRDPSHVRDHRVSEWEAMLGEAGLSSECLGRWPIHQDFLPWVERIGTSAGGVVGLRALFDEAPAEVREAFGIRGGGNYAFRIESALLRGSAPA